MSGQASPATVSVVVLNWNGREDTLACLQSLRGIDYPSFKIHVVDNASSDDSVSSIRAAFPEVEIICSARNLGYAGGNNLGIRRALEVGAQYILLLNNDTVVPPLDVERVVSKLRTQKGIVIDYDVVEGASHFWMENLPEVETRVGNYLDKRLAANPA